MTTTFIQYRRIHECPAAFGIVSPIQTKLSVFHCTFSIQYQLDSTKTWVSSDTPNNRLIPVGSHNGSISEVAPAVTKHTPP